MVSNKYLFFDNLKGDDIWEEKNCRENCWTISVKIASLITLCLFDFTKKKLILEAFPRISEKSEYQE